MAPKYHKVVTWLVFVGFASRMVIPIGYMPAALGDGGPIKLCPGGVSPALIQFFEQRRRGHQHDGGDQAPDDGGHRSHSSSSDTEHDGWRHCPVGTVFSWAPLAAQVDLGVQMLGHVLAVSAPSVPVNLLSDTPYRARAPPIS